MESVTIWLAFGAGVLSFISPCCLPLYPSFLSYITGVSVAELQGHDRSQTVVKKVMIHTALFLLGFSIIFYALGFALSLAGQLFENYQDLLRMLSAILIIAMGLFLTGIFQPAFLMREKRLDLSKKGFGYVSSFFIGIGFAAGWTPCLGPILGSVLLIAANDPDRGFWYLTTYILGFAIPFFLMAFFVGRAKWILRYSERLMKIGGILLIVFGILLYTDQMTVLITMLTRWTGGFTGF
ncbi:cytochrome c biogenesis CcdA family protein [Risungbinella massiliensis]|uniref:cytochrome c biogenesis CcdA family protein n=1 Tax=Risungbinella massiliensis TaxID=1329796 RepID=UPI0005CC1688|nr:cytochrome c biogenesis protein CcdA [Risungbinella massiliensis]